MEYDKEFEKIRKRIPYSTIGMDYTDIYTIIKKAGSFEKSFDKEITRLENQGINAGTCLNYFEEMVDGYIKKLLSILEIEHLKHKSTIGYFFRKRASDRIEFQELLNDLEAEIVSIAEEYTAVKDIYEKYNPLKNGRLAGEDAKDGSAKEDSNE